MQINPLIFRGYDIRGVAGTDLSPEIMKHLARSYATFLAKRRVRHAVVGRDTRKTSPEYHQAFMEGLVESGVHVIDIGTCLTQMMYWAQYHYKTNGGAIITASHNPKEWNGVKLATGYSNTLVGTEVQDIRIIAEKEEYVSGQGTLTDSKMEYVPHYYEDLLKRIEIKRPLKVVIDTSNATCGLYLGDILRKAGCEVVEQNKEIDPEFPCGTPDPTEKAVQERLAKGVLQAGADLGFSYDADGDRIGIVDEKGNIIWNDVLVALFAKDVLSRFQAGKIVYNVLCSKLVDDVIKEMGGRPIRWITGHSYIKEKIAIERAPFGGELSGHFFFVDNFYGHDDGAFASLRLLEFLSCEGRSLSEVIATLPRYLSSPEIKLGVPDSERFTMVSRMKEDFLKKYPDAEKTDIDGVRLDFEDAMFVVRASQNGGYLTIKYEARTEERFNELKASIREVLEQYPEVNWESGINTDAI
jgi:phosphomannomutase/phosphoglucomutase